MVTDPKCAMRAMPSPPESLEADLEDSAAVLVVSEALVAAMADRIWALVATHVDVLEAVAAVAAVAVSVAATRVKD